MANTMTLEMMDKMVVLTQAGWSKEEILQVINASLASSVATAPVQVAPAMAVDTPPVPAKQEKVVRRLTADEILAEIPAKQEHDASTVGFGCWKSINREGEEYTWCGWANVNNGEADFPGHQMYRVNDFYLKKLGIKHSCYKDSNGEVKFSTKYNIRTGNAKALIAQYQVRSKVALKDKDEFMKYIEQYDKAKKAVNDSWFEA